MRGIDETMIHMNGRIYDPIEARFMLADPIVQAATHAQSYNRYAYVWNNPLNATDPSGYQVHWNEVRGAVKTAVIIAIQVLYHSIAKPVRRLWQQRLQKMNGADDHGVFSVALTSALTMGVGQGASEIKHWAVRAY